MQRETLEFDVVIVGAGPAGLAAACRIGQLAATANQPFDVCVVEKGAAVGAHVISGAVFEPRALHELFPDWRACGAPVLTEVTGDRLMWLLNDRDARAIPRPFVPRPLRNQGNYVISLGELCAWLALQAEALGCHVLTSTAACDLLLDADGTVVGVATGPLGLDRAGEATPGSEPGYDLRARYVIFAEGCRGSLMRRLDEVFGVLSGGDPQHYGIGIKEVWEIESSLHRPGSVEHTFGWPLSAASDGGGFVYHGQDNQVALGMIVSLAYRHPYLDPFAEMQRWKHHPEIRRVLAGGRRIAFGARAVNKGGLQSLARLAVPGGLLVGCEAGFLNPGKIKGTHTAMKTGMLAAECIFAALTDHRAVDHTARRYEEAVRESWVWAELRATRNFAPSVARFGPLIGGALAVLEQNILRRSLPLTLRNRRIDRDGMLTVDAVQPIDYPAPDGVVSFDRASSVHLANIHHREDQPPHLHLLDADVHVSANLARFDEPAQRYCPVGVYEILQEPGAAPRLQINAGNCVHCKTCDIKDPANNIRWTAPEGGSGPNYVRM